MRREKHERARIPAPPHRPQHRRQQLALLRVIEDNISEDQGIEAGLWQERGGQWSRAPDVAAARDVGERTERRVAMLDVVREVGEEGRVRVVGHDDAAGAEERGGHAWQAGACAEFEDRFGVDEAWGVVLEVGCCYLAGVPEVVALFLGGVWEVSAVLLSWMEAQWRMREKKGEGSVEWNG